MNIPSLEEIVHIARWAADAHQHTHNSHLINSAKEKLLTRLSHLCYISGNLVGRMVKKCCTTILDASTEIPV